MRPRGVSLAVLLVSASLLYQVSCLEDLYLEGDEDASNEFLEVKPEDIGTTGHLGRIKRGISDFLDFFNPSSNPTTTTTEAPEITDDLDADDGQDEEHGSGSPDREEDLGEKTLRVTFVVMEPYRPAYSNRDSPEFLNFSKTIGDAVDLLYKSIPGQQKASLVRIQSRVSDAFSCKVTLDIVTTNYDNLDEIGRILVEHIKNRRELGEGHNAVKVSDAGFSTLDINPSLNSGDVVCEANEIRCSDNTCIPGDKYCNGVFDCFDGGDESNCPFDDNGEIEQGIDLTTELTECTRVRCDNSAVTICADQACDGIFDCPGQDDEFGCGQDETTPPPVYSTTVIPTTNESIPNCPEGDFVCDNTRCVNSNLRCDGIPDCNDGADEAGCTLPESCGLDDFRCSNGKCLEARQKCDGIVDCPNEEDEHDCNCREDEFQCVSDKSCIEGRKRCDSVNNCRDGSDEQNCPCSSDQWQCDFGNCIKRSKRCDGRVDCPTDRSDERGCTANEQFRCKGGKILPDYKRCNRRYDCPVGDYSDEQNCPCGDGDFKCANGNCIPASKHCDRTHDCQDGSDERDCTYGTVCMAFQYKCTSGECVPAESKCNGTRECSDLSDEHNCPCKRDQFSCRDGTCINLALRCNGRRDCHPAGEDEFNCASANACPSDAFACNPGSSVVCAKRCDGRAECDSAEDENNCDECSHYCDGRCLADSQICDGTIDCDDGSDEVACDHCDGPYDFRCADGECIGASQHCNGIPECRDSSDELQCNKTMISSPACSPDEFRCNNGICINSEFQCDRNPDCDDQSDELNCEYDCDPNTEWQCRSGACIPKSAYCDEYTDCADASDELNCQTTTPATTPRRYPAETTAGYPTGDYDRNELDTNFDGRDDYDRNEPRLDYDTTTQGSDRNRYDSDFNRPTQGGQNNGGRPGSGYDRPNQGGFNGGRPDNGWDRPNQSGSNNGGQPDNGWDRRPNQGGFNGDNGWDRPNQSGSNGEQPEYGYDRPNQGGDTVSNRVDGNNKQPGGVWNNGQNADRDGCNRNEWRCENGPCITSYRRCDGKIDCPFDSSDEFDCPAGSPFPLNLKTYPPDQGVRNGGDVVFQCRDEGPLRAAVKWVRQGNRPLKPGSVDLNGRLEMNAVTASDSGVYVCQAVGYLGQPNSEVTVILNVDPTPVTARPRDKDACRPDQATCANGQCIPKKALCDNVYDCSDRSDEEACFVNGKCEPNQFKCNNNKCVLKTWRCDSEDDCGDGSDEQNCVTYASVPGQCTPVEFACTSGDQCVPKSFHCDGQSDCLDKSDEIGCAPVYVTRPPQPSNVHLNVGDTLTLECAATGTPTPIISWRRNWGDVPENCRSENTQTSGQVIGTLVCTNMQPEHNGAYSCEALNNKGTIFAVPDAIVFVNRTSPCPSGYFNSEARSESECIRCFCFGESTTCRSADLFIYNMPTALGEGGTRLIGVKNPASGNVEVDKSFADEYYYQPLRNGATVIKLARYGSRDTSGSQPYITLPESYNGNQLTSYGGHIRYRLTPHLASYNIPSYGLPDVIVKGKYQNLFHFNRGNPNVVEARFIPGSWEKAGPQGRLVPATREDIMMALDNIELVLLRSSVNNAGVNITDFTMESAHHFNTGLGAANLVEECSCPPGYEGLSCQKCASGFVREQTNRWLGDCKPERTPCPPGTYGDPNSGYACRPCPCPLTNRENQFARTCSIGASGTVECDCNPGYEGKNCEYCAEGYQGNPLAVGDSCKPKPRDNCNPVGTSHVRLPDECECKDHVQGRYCDQCKNDSFYLSNDFRQGCALCFCSGVSQQCRSSNLRRKVTTVPFNNPDSVNRVKVYSSTPLGTVAAVRYHAPVETNLTASFGREELVLTNYDRNRPAVYYWSLPIEFAGDKVTSYGGYLRYKLNNVPAPGYNSKNNAADVQLISDNGLTFHYFGNFEPSFDGILDASVQFLEKGWQRPDGKEVARQHFLLALADVKAILVKMSYTTNSRLASLISASIDTAELNGVGPAALHVEQCVCPREYVGTSCEDCAPGYTRLESGLYLEHCGPCQCNGHSTMCDPENGVCFNCQDNTDGDYCEQCRPGYKFDVYGKCVPESSTPNCNCNPAGSSGPCDENGNCACKVNVEGPNCDVCRRGTFGLDASNPDGCYACYCSGATSECHEASSQYIRMPMAAPVFGDDNGGYTLMDLNAQRVISDQIVSMPVASELMYVFPFPPDEELYWSLPVFPGNRILSYGGTLQLKQRFESSRNPVSEPGTDVVLVSDDKTLYWSNPQAISAGQGLTYKVPLTERGWFVLNTGVPASRSEFLSVLKNLRRVLVRATLANNIESTSIADVSMDTATAMVDPAFPPAIGVEVCICPPGYSGTSCESCATGYYKDRYGCQRCNCNGHDCYTGPDEQVVCNCRPPYTGSDCSILGLVMELHPTIMDDGRPDSLYRRVILTCKYRAPEPLTITFYEEGKKIGPSKDYRKSILGKDGWRGEHSLRTVWDTRRQGEIYECHTITQKGFTLGVLATSLPEPADKQTEEELSTPAPPPQPTVFVQITSNKIKIEDIGGSVNFTCQAQSRMANNLPVTWSKKDGYLPQGRTQFIDRLGMLIITNLQVSDSGRYICQTTDGISTAQAYSMLTVKANAMTQPTAEIRPPINDYFEGERIQLECIAGGYPTPTISWQRNSGRALPQYAVVNDDLFIIENAREEDSGEYRCTVTSSVGSADRTAVVNVRQRPPQPSSEKLTVSQQRPTILEGQNTRITCTGTANVPVGTIDWVRQDGTALDANVRSINGVLHIDYAQTTNQGVYICQSSSYNVQPVLVVVTVTPIGTPPPDQVPAVNTTEKSLKIPTGGTGTVDCNPSGFPLPLIRWKKHDGSFGDGTNQRQNTLIITNARESDQGYYLCEGIINGQTVASVYVYVEIEKREAPRISIYPGGEQAVTLGSPFELRCTVLGGVPEPLVTWSRAGGRPLSPLTEIQPNNILYFNRIEVNDEGEYSCSATNVAGTESASTIIKVRSAPVVSITPTQDIHAVYGDTIRVECRADGYPQPMVSIKNELHEIVAPTPGIAVLNIPYITDRDQGDFTCLANSPAGTIEEQFVINVDVRGDGGFGNDEGSGESDLDPDSFLDRYPGNDQPRDMIAIEGQITTIRCAVTGNLDVQWTRADRRPLQAAARQEGSSLVIRGTSKQDSGQYVCNLIDRYSGDVTNSATTSLVVLAAPRITLQPPTQTVHPGDSPIVECVVDGDEVEPIVWRPITRPFSSRVEVRGSTLIFNRIEVEDAGKYECLAKNRVASVAATAEVIVSEENDRAPSESHDNEQRAHVGAAVHLSCNVASPGIKITWTKDGRQIPRSVVQRRDGSLYIRLAQKSDTGHYVCNIQDRYGRRTSNYINLHIDGDEECKDPHFRCYDQSRCILAKLLCDGVPDCPDNSDEENCILREKRLRDRHADYSLGGEEQEQAPIVSIDQPRRQFRVGDNVEVMCRARSRGDRVVWERYGTRQYVDYRTFGGGAMLIVNNVQESDAGLYRCTGSDPYGRTTYEDFDLEVIPGNPVWPSNPSDKLQQYTVRQGESIDLPCNPNLPRPYSVQWRREYTPLKSEVRAYEQTLHLDRITEADAGTYVCRVSNDRASEDIRSVLRVAGVVPRFDGSGWISLPTLKEVYRQFDIEISFKPMDRNGLILYNSEKEYNTYGDGDYLSLQLVDGVPQFQLNAGSEPLLVSGDRPLQLNTWHTIRISKTNSKLIMDVDNNGPTSVPSTTWDLLELRQPLYIGGVPDYNSMPPDTTGFIGCVSMLVVGNQEKNIMLDRIRHSSVLECDSCTPNLCNEHGTCQEARNERGYACICAAGYAGLNCDRTGEACRPNLCGPGKCTDLTDGYRCSCPVTYTGKNCEIKQSIEYPAFTGSAYLAIKAPEAARYFDMSLKLKAAEPVTDGIIMYSAESARGYGGFMALTVHNRRLEFTYDLGDGTRVVLTSNRPLPANEWVDVDIVRLGTNVSLNVDRDGHYEKELNSTKSVINFETPMFVGGADESIALNRNTGVTGGFHGCIKDVVVFKHSVDIIGSSIQSANVQECSKYDRGDIPEADSICSQCRNGGQCTEDGSACECPDGFAGRYCETRVPPLARRRPAIDPCALQPCRNGGSCRRDLSNQMNYTCDCKLGFAGTTCQMALELKQSVGFNGNGYLELPAIRLRYDRLSQEPVVIAIAFYTNADGVLLYQREVAARPNTGDYILIRIENGIIVMEWDLGAGRSIVSIEDVYVADLARHSVIVKLMDDGSVSMTVDGITKSAASNGFSNVMNADSNIYVGGIPESLNVNQFPGLSGCVEQIELMDTVRGINLGQEAVAGRNTQRCRNP